MKRLRIEKRNALIIQLSLPVSRWNRLLECQNSVCLVKRICIQLGPMLSWKSLYTSIFNKVAYFYSILNILMCTPRSWLLAPFGRLSFNLHTVRKFEHLIFENVVFQNPNNFWPRTFSEEHNGSEYNWGFGIKKFWKSDI